MNSLIRGIALSIAVFILTGTVSPRLTHPTVNLLVAAGGNDPVTMGKGS